MFRLVVRNAKLWRWLQSLPFGISVLLVLAFVYLCEVPLIVAPSFVTLLFFFAAFMVLLISVASAEQRPRLAKPQQTEQELLAAWG